MQSFTTSDNNSTCKTNASREIVRQAGLLILQHRSFTSEHRKSLKHRAQKSHKVRPNKHRDQIYQSKSIKTLDVIPPLLSTSIKKVTKNTSVKMWIWFTLRHRLRNRPKKFLIRRCLGHLRLQQQQQILQDWFGAEKRNAHWDQPRESCETKGFL